MHECIMDIRTYVHTYIDTDKYNIHTCVSAYVNIYIATYIYTYAHKYLNIYNAMYIWKYTYIHAFACTYVYHITQNFNGDKLW